MLHRIVTRGPAALAVLVTALAACLVPAGSAQGYVQGETIAGSDYDAVNDPASTGECPVGTTPRGVRVVSVRGFSNDVRMLCEKGGALQPAPAGSYDVPDGVTEDIVCATGQRPVGLYARTGSIVDSVGVRCEDAAGVRSDGPISLGTGGGPDGPVDCAELSVVRGFTMAKSTRFSGGGDLQVSMIGPICSQRTTLTKLTSGPLQLRPRAKLVLAASGEPLAGRRISFGSCSARTNAQGIATCPLALGLGAVTATYAGDGRTEPSSARS